MPNKPPPDTPGEVANPFETLKTFGRKQNIKPRGQATGALPELKQRKSERRHQEKERGGDRRVASPLQSGYSGMERRGKRGDRRGRSDRRQPAVHKAIAEKNFYDTLSSRRKQAELWYTSPRLLELESPRLHDYEDFIHDTLTKTLDALKFAYLSKKQAGDEISMLVKEIVRHHNFVVSHEELEH